MIKDFEMRRLFWIVTIASVLPGGIWREITEGGRRGDLESEKDSETIRCWL